MGQTQFCQQINCKIKPVMEFVPSKRPMGRAGALEGMLSYRGWGHLCVRNGFLTGACAWVLPKRMDPWRPPVALLELAFLERSHHVAEKSGLHEEATADTLANPWGRPPGTWVRTPLGCLQLQPFSDFIHMTDPEQQPIHWPWSTPEL